MKFAHVLSLATPSSEPGDWARTPQLAVVRESEALILEEFMDDAPRDLQELIEQGPDALRRVKAVVDNVVANKVAGTPLADLGTASAVLRPPVILAIGLNYVAHSAELALPADTKPTVFSLWPNSLSGHQSVTSWPADVSSSIDYEAELGVIIGRRATNVTVADALDHVFGYTVVNDMTARDIQFSEAQWSRCKSFDGFTPTGPVVVTADQITDPQDLWLTTNLDGKIMQDASSGDMVRTVAELISYLSRSTTLQPGTLISTGSPGGAGYSRDPQVFLKDGSTVTVTIDGIGQLTTYCRVT